MKAKILLTAIFKDDSEIELATRMLGSFMPYMSGLAVAITGVSGEHTKLKDLIESYKGKYIVTTPVSHPKIYGSSGDQYFFANFAEARNVSFDLAAKMQEKEHFDWWSWADIDDVLVGGEQLLDAATMGIKNKNKIDAVYFTYWYSVRVKADGTFSEKDVVIDHTRERLIRPGVFKWISRLHEITVPIDGNYKPYLAPWEFDAKLGQYVAWAHITDDVRVDGALKRNIKILEIQAREEEHKDPRTLFYLAKTYYDLNTPQDNGLAEALIQEYLEMSGWAEERSNAWEYLGNIWVRRGDHRKAIDCYHTALKEYPNRHMPILLMAREYSELGLNEESNFWLDVALKMSEPKARTTIGNPMEIKLFAASLKYNQAIKEVKIDDAIHWLKVRNSLMEITDDKMLVTLEEAKLLNTAATWVYNYAKWLKDHNHEENIKYLLQSLPFDLGREPFAHYLANEVSKPRVWEKNEIAYYASWGAEHFEEWSPKSLGSGIGGSETAVIELAKRWAKDGYKVTVYGDPRDNAGEHDSVTYRPWYEINWNDSFNVLILWRAPHLLDKEVKARHLYYDAHDIESQLNWTDERMKKIDKVFFKSKWHRGHVPKLPDSKAVVIHNGI